MTETWDLIEGQNTDGEWTTLSNVKSSQRIDHWSWHESYVSIHEMHYLENGKEIVTFCLHWKSRFDEKAVNKFFPSINSACAEFRKVRHRLNVLEMSVAEKTKLDEFLEIDRGSCNAIYYPFIIQKVIDMIPCSANDQELKKETLKFMILCILDRAWIKGTEQIMFLKELYDFVSTPDSETNILEVRDDYTERFRKELVKKIQKQKLDLANRRWGFEEDEKKDE